MSMPGGASGDGEDSVPDAPGQQANQPPQQPEPPRAPSQPQQPQASSQPPPHQPAQSGPHHAPLPVPGQPPHAQPPPAPGQPPHQQPPHQHPLPRAAVTVPLGKMLYLCVAALGVINLFLGYVSAGDGDSMNLYKVGVAIYALAPTMFFLAGLVAVREFLPRERAPGALPAMITTAIFVTLVLSAISSDGAGDLQTLFLVFGAVQFVLAWLAYVFDVGIIGARR
ncbi:DUF5336 domain-containing protein [Catenulispora sp. EB89]|uniref:DUF5336 domain-containing protein n=1 Tax=Catenulispora sp. EB89 TaxID=3156257 RepID=UPI003512D25A